LMVLKNFTSLKAKIHDQ